MAGMCCWCCRPKRDEEEVGTTVAVEQQLGTDDQHHQLNGNGSSDTSTIGSFHSTADDDAAISSPLPYQLDLLTLVEIKRHLSSLEVVYFESLNGRFANIRIKRLFRLQVTARSEWKGDFELIVCDKNGAQIVRLHSPSLAADIRRLFTQILSRFHHFHSISIRSKAARRLPLTLKNLLAAAEEIGVIDVRRFELKFNEPYCYTSVECCLADWLKLISPSVRHLHIDQSPASDDDDADFVQLPAVAAAISGCHHLRSVDLLRLAKPIEASEEAATAEAVSAQLLSAIGALPHLHTLRIVGKDVPTVALARRTLTLSDDWLLSAVGSTALMHFVGRTATGGFILYTDKYVLSSMAAIESVISSLPSSSIAAAAPRSVTVHFRGFFGWYRLKSLMIGWLQMAGRHLAEIAITDCMPTSEEFGKVAAKIERANIAGLLPLPDYDPQQLTFQFNDGAHVRLTP